MHTPHTLSRRRFTKVVAGGALAALGAGALTAAPASAGRSWCRLDPIFRLNGKKLHVYLSGSTALHDVVTGPTAVTLKVPNRGVESEFVWADDGFGGLGYDVSIVGVDWLDVDPDGDIAFEVEVLVPGSDELGVLVEAVHEHKGGKKTSKDQRHGRTNRPVKLRAKL